VSDVWVKVFNIIERQTPNKRISEIHSYIDKLQYELDDIRKKMKETSYSNKLYDVYIERAEQAISIANMNQVWTKSKELLLPSNDVPVIYALKWCAETMADEPVMDQESINELQLKIKELEKEIQDSNLPDSTVELLRHLIAIMQKSINMSPISGRKAMDDAFKSIVAEATLHNEELKSLPEKSKNTLKRCWEVIQRASSVIEAIGQVSSSVGKVLEIFSK
jgi:hypothetical protein